MNANHDHSIRIQERGTAMQLRFLALAAVIFAAPGLARAGGFAISENGSVASGRGTAAAALYGDPSSVIYNPANVSRGRGLQLSLGGSGLMPKWTHSAGGTLTESETGIVPPPNFSATWQLGDTGIGDLGAGLGVYVPYGSTFAWPALWNGREQIQEIGLTVFEISPVLALRPHRTFALGAGFRYLPSSVYMKQAVQFPGGSQDGSLELGGTGSGVGASAGLSFWPMEGLSLAFVWRSPVTLKMEGESDFDFPAPFDAMAVDRDVRTEVPLAQVFRFGVAWDALPGKLNLSADLEYQLWSEFKELAITFVNPDGSEEIKASPRNSQDSFVVHVGGEYKVTDRFAVRAGYIWDQHTLPEETVNPAPPDSDKHVASVGASYLFDRFGVHAHFSNVFFARRTANTSDFPGEWDGAWPGGTMAYMFGLSLSANLDAPAPFGAPANN
jgi:long-chain fatty acid transport protein